jgi:hypothetical protein
MKTWIVYLLLASVCLARSQVPDDVQKAADQGNAGAQDSIGDIFFFGKGVTKDYAQAMVWFKKAADQDNADAQFKIGGMYYAGDGVPQDYSQAMEWYRKAAAHGNADAPFSIGIMYELGTGVAADKAQAREWYKKAAARGNANVLPMISDMCEKGEIVAKDPVQAMQWYENAAKGNADAQLTVGQTTNAPAPSSLTVSTETTPQPNTPRIVATDSPSALGKTEQDFEKQYGAPTSDSQNYGRVIVEVFTKNTFTITITFLDKKAISIRYEHITENDSLGLTRFAALTPEEVAILLDKNSEGQTWKKDDDVTFPTWTRDGATAHKESNLNGDYLDVWYDKEAIIADDLMDAANAKQ